MHLATTMILTDRLLDVADRTDKPDRQGFIAAGGLRVVRVASCNRGAPLR